MKKSELKAISQKYAETNFENVLQFVLHNFSKKAKKWQILIDGKVIYDARDDNATNYFVLTTGDFKKVAVSGDLGTGIETTVPRTTVYSLFMDELKFTENDLENLEFVGDCGKTVQILAKPDDFFGIHPKNK